jgi:hypothetical protein
MEGKQMMQYLRPILEDSLSYLPGDTVLFHGPDANRTFEGVIQKGEISWDTEGISLHYHVEVERNDDTLKYAGIHIITDDDIIEHAV